MYKNDEETFARYREVWYNGRKHIVIQHFPRYFPNRRSIGVSRNDGFGGIVWTKLG